MPTISEGRMKKVAKADDVGPVWLCQICEFIAL